MYTGRESIEDIVKDTKTTFQRSFMKEGEIAYITLNLKSTKNEILAEVPESNYEKEYLKKNYDNILRDIKNELKKSNIIFVNANENIKEKEEIISKINKIYLEYQKLYENNKDKYGEFDEELKRWDSNITDIYNTISTEFSVESLEKIYNIIYNNNNRTYITVQIIDKAQYYSSIIGAKIEDIKKCQINERQGKRLMNEIDKYTKYLQNIDLKNKPNNDTLNNVLDNIIRQGDILIQDTNKIIEDNIKQKEIAKERMYNEVESLAKTAKKFMIWKFLFGDKK